MRYTVSALALLPMLLLFGCTQQPSVSEATATFCQDLTSLQKELAALNDLTPNSTVGELNQARDRIQIALDKVDASKSLLQNVKLDELDAAEENLQDTITGLSSKDTLADAAT